MFSKEHQAKFIAGGMRHRRLKKIRAAEVSSGKNLGGGLNQDNDPRRAHIDVTPAVWRRAGDWVGDCEYVDDGLDDVLLRALRERVVYAGSLCCHHQVPFQDITIAALAAADKEFRKNGKRQSRGLLKGQPSKPAKVAVPVAPVDPVKLAKKTGYREGASLLDVVEELFKKE